MLFVKVVNALIALPSGSDCYCGKSSKSIVTHSKCICIRFPLLWLAPMINSSSIDFYWFPWSKTMSKEGKKDKKDKKNCASKRGLMLVFGLTTLGSRVISAVSLAAIALGFCHMKNESRLFTQCVEEIRDSGQSASDAVSFCNGG